MCPEVRLTVVAMVFIYREDTLQGPELPSSKLCPVCERRYMDLVKETMKLVSVREVDAVDWLRWRQMIGCDQPLKRTANMSGAKTAGARSS